MKKIVYCVGSEWITNETSGVSKKIKNEILALQNSGFEVERICVNQTKKLLRIIPFKGRHAWNRVKINTDVDTVYFRYEFSSFPLLIFLRRLKKKKPNQKIIMEIGMYPYIEELKKISNPLTIVRDIFYCKFLKKYIDRIVTFNEFDEIFGIKTIFAVNCINVGAIKVPNRVNYRNDNVINILAVAQIEFYYGYDRLLKGISNYYKDESIIDKADIQFHLVGNGHVVSELKQMCKFLNIENYVTFYGFKTGKELDDIYELADIGIDVLGGHRKDDYCFGTLKSREYMCKGLPFVTEYTLPKEISPIYKYILKAPDDESDIDVQQIVDFFNEIKREHRETTIKNMRNFAYSYCDISVAINPVIKYLREGK